MSWRKGLNAVKKGGFKIIYQRRDHIYLTDGEHKITVPRHDPIKKGTLLSILKQAGMEKSEFIKLVRKK